MIYVILVVVSCFCAFFKLWCRKDSILEPPALSGRLPIVGHALMLIRHDLQKLNIITLKEILDNGITTCHVGFKKIYIVTDPEAVMTIFNTCLEKEEIIFKFLRPFLGEGLVTTGSVSTWQKHRKLLNPAFSYSKLKSFINIFNTQARSLTKRLDLQLGKPFTHERTLKLNNLETICLTAAGITDDECILREKYLPLFTKVLEIFNERIRRPWLHSDIFFNLSSLKRKQDVISKQLSELSYAIMQKKKEEIKSTERLKDNTKTHKSFLELMLGTSKETASFTDEQIIAEVNTIIAAGYETVGVHMNIMLIVLGSHQNVQEIVYNEICQLDGGLDKDLNTDDLSKLVYTEAVLKETLRLYMPVPGTARHLQNNIQIKNYTLLANSTCILNIYGLNRHPVWGPDADQFRPERWLDTAKLPDMNHLGSFALGRRNCIGKAYAMLLMKITLVHLVRRYRITADISKVKFKWRLTAYPASGNQYTLERRDITDSYGKLMPDK